MTNAHPMVTRSKTGTLRPIVFMSDCNFPSSFLFEVEPKSAKAAMADPKWYAAMTNEFRTLEHKRGPADEELDHVHSSSYPYTGLAVCDQALHQRSRATVKLDRKKVDLGS
ncbi:hypothetical protein LWI29_030184 [Acer saccharum]|uniref:Uncharacterized protein n=1 Tax=Acer saccharum TaxID=4024 RepID=A0AA39S3S8_ACESA|nr:hypothetical protein LWI29_030184 [Acer saccharum]